MFGQQQQQQQQQNRPAFGGFGTSTPFGATTKSSGFGSTGTSTFGSTSGGFGSSTPAASSSLFGGNTTSTPATGGIFGGSTGGTFGQQPTQTGGGFTFGQGTPQTQSTTGSSLFGSTSQSGGTGLFSTPTTNSTFGTKTPGAFGTNTQPGGLFGSTSTANTSLFGSTTTQQPQQQTTGLFGNASGGFTAGTAVQQSAGTTIKFAPPTGQDTMLKAGVSTNINTRHQCITAMKEYETKCLEELRSEDYAASRKGPQAGATTAATGGMFGGTTATQNPQSGGSFSLFGQQNQQQKQQGTFGFSGTNTSTSGGMFGGTSQSSTGGLFGAQQQQQNKPLFGGATTTTASSGGFGGGFSTGNTGGLFQPNKPGGLFGGVHTTQSSGLFANPVATTSNNFGGFGSGGFSAASTAQQNQAGGLFAKVGGFGPPAVTTSSSGFGFGTTTQKSAGLFGVTPTTSTSTGGGFSFGQNNTGTQQTTLFAKPGGFGAPTTGTALGGFGGTGTNFSTLGQPSTGGAFTQNRPFGSTLGTIGTSGTTFGGATTGTTLFGSAPPTLGSTDASAAAQQAQITQQLMVLNNAPYGDNPLFRNLKQTESKKEELSKPTNPAAQKAALNTSAQYKVNSRPTAKIKPKPLHSIANGKAQLFEGLEEDEASTFGNDTFQPRRSVKKLVIKGDNNRSLNRSQLSSSRAESEAGTDELGAPSPIIDNDKSSQRNILSNQEPSSLPTMRTSTEKKPTQPDSLPEYGQQKKSNITLDSTIVELNVKNRLRTALEESRFDSSGEQDNFDNLSDRSSSPPPHPAGIILRRPGYYILPSLEDLADCTEDDGSCFVENLVIGREGYGNVLFPGEVNVAGLNLDDFIHFRRKEITVYPDDENKPDVGQGLNRRAQVTLDCVWPTNKTTHSPIKDMDRLKDMAYQDRLERASAKIGAKFIDYRPETGSWVFEVKHFSKYGLVDSDDEDDGPMDPQKVKQIKELQQKTLAVQKEKIKLIEQQKQQQASKGGLLLGAPEQMAMGDDCVDSTSQSQSGDIETRVGGLLQQTRPSLAPRMGVQAFQESGDTMMQDDSDMPDIMTEKLPDNSGTMDSCSEMAGAEHIPSSHRLALGLGVRAHDLQIRKASFFGDEDEELVLGSKEGLSRKKFSGGLSGFIQSPVQQSILASPLPKQRDMFSPDKSVWSTSFKQPHQFSPNKPLSPYRSAFVEQPKAGLQKPIPGVKEHMLIPSGLSEYEKNRTRKIVGTRTQRHIFSLKDSLLFEKQRCISDMGLFHGRKFRVGWGPQWSLVHAGKPLMKQEDEDDDETPKFSLVPNAFGPSQKRLDTSPFQLCIEKVHTDPLLIFTDPNTLELVEQCLKIQLENSESSQDFACPIFVPKIGVQALHNYSIELKQHINHRNSHPDKPYVDQMSAVFDLCVALWGNVPELLLEEDMDKNNYHYNMGRREALSRWLSKMAIPKINAEIEKANVKGMGEITAVFSHLTGRQISECCLMAQETGDHRLALLMAQAVGSDLTRQMLKTQLDNWEKTQADQFIDPTYLKVYTLLAGHMVWPASHLSINVCDNLDWKRCLALHLWYHCPPQATIADALRHYNHAYDGNSPQDKYAAPPLPPYIEDNDEPYDERQKIHDMCYHLLKLYCDRSHELHVLLNPCTVTPNTLDYRLSWHLCQILQSLEYQHLSEYHHSSLCCNYASQLESMGLWHWAVFVLLHLQNHAQREAAVKELLVRHVEIESSDEEVEKEKFICDNLHIPFQWLHEAKAIKARIEQSPHEEAWHLLKANKWNDCHRILLKHVASEAIINEHFDYLKRFLLELGSSEHCVYIQDWAIGGKVFLDYINMIQTIEQLKQGEPSGYELERLQPEVTSLAKRISHLQCCNAKDRLCQSEMAKRVANVMKTLMTMQHPDEDVSARLFAPVITQLPMPEDYALQELRQLTRSYMMEVTMS